MTNNPSQGEPQGLADLGPPPPYLRDIPMKQASAEIRALAVSCVQIASSFWGAPSSSNDRECRWGTHGSRCVNLEKNAWYDHETKAGGYTIELVERELGCSRAEAISWLLDDKNYSATTELPNLNGKQTSGPRARPVATYDYTDENGTLLWQALRYEPRRFLQRRPGPDGKWIWSVTGVQQVPYRLRELSGDIDECRVIAIVEGEKDVNNLREVGIPATCNAGGAEKWHPELSRYFRGTSVVLIPDNDDPGRRHMDKVGQSLMRVATEIRILKLPNLPPKGDVSDWLAAGGTREELARLITQAPQWRLRAPFATDEQQSGEFMDANAGSSESTFEEPQATDEREPTQREKLVSIGLEAELWHDKDGNTFATIAVDQHQENFALKNTGFRSWLTREYGERYQMKVGGRSCPSAPSSQALSEALNALGAKAASGPEH